MRPTIAVVALGGTIAAPVQAGGARLALTADDLVALVPASAAVAELRAVTFREVISTELGFADVLALAAEITRLVDGGVDGVVVTQGTDTLEETAFALDLLVATTVPVVVTGAMRNAGQPGADGPSNLAAAVRVAASPEAAGVGVLVVMGDEVHAARFVRKAHATSPAAFDSRPLGPVGWVVEDRVRLPLVPRSRLRQITIPAASTAGGWPLVALMTHALDGDDRLIRAAAADYGGLVVEVFGAGHTSARLLGALAEAAQAIPVVFASRTGTGELYRSTGAFPGSERDLLSRGLISAVALPGPKAHVLLTLALAAGEDRAAIAERFEEAAG